MNLKLREEETGKIIDRVELYDQDSQKDLGKADAADVFQGLKCRNLTLDTDLYELTMSAGYSLLGKAHQRACFDLYFRQPPDNGAFCIFAGLESVVDYITHIGFFPDDIDYLASLGTFSKETLSALSQGVRFSGDLWAVPEGSVVFPHEPLIRVIGPIPEAQLIETTMLALVGHQTLIATKAARMCLATKGAPVVDFGTRRAHGVQAALYGARAAYIGGCSGTSNVRAGKLFGIPVRGTHAHSWVESFDNELEAFDSFSQVFPKNCVLLVDTYDTLTGVRNAITVAKRMEESGHRLMGIRIDSGDLAYYSKAARRLLNEAGLDYVKILASSDLDEWIIESLRDQGAEIDIWCVGTRLMTSYQTPALSVVYKLMAADRGDGVLAPKIKISQNPNKVTNPGVKKIVRFYNGKDRMMGDLLAEVDEPLPVGKAVTAHHPMYDYMKKTYKPPYRASELMVPIFLQGKLVYEQPSIEEIRQRARQEIESLEPEYKRLTNPHIYKVSLSDRLYKIKKSLLTFHQKAAKRKQV
jgi:nicotinate phosphoribosyltransferase